MLNEKKDEQIKGRSKKGQEDTAITVLYNDEVLNQGGGHEVTEKWPDVVYVLMVKLIGGD